MVEVQKHGVWFLASNVMRCLDLGSFSVLALLFILISTSLANISG